MAVNLSIRKAAKKSGLTYSYISRVLRRRKNPRLETAVKIARAMGISLDRLQKIREERDYRNDPKEDAPLTPREEGLLELAAKLRQEAVEAIRGEK